MKFLIRFLAPALFILLIIAPSQAQTPDVPEVMEFAGMRLKLTREAQRSIQTDVAALRRNPKYFQIKIDRAAFYFPVIERIFREEGLPDDFKYLSLQESALISDAVSTSNAVGFWQFKKESAIEVGLRVDNYIDERCNIFSSSRGAAKYLKRNNIFFDNWIFSLLSYNLGMGGAEKVVNSKYYGRKEMVIDETMHWYVLKFLAHKIAFQNDVPSSSQQILVAYKDCNDKTIKEISKDLNLEEQILKDYNKWLKGSKIDNDKEYLVAVFALL